MNFLYTKFAISRLYIQKNQLVKLKNGFKNSSEDTAIPTAVSTEQNQRNIKTDTNGNTEHKL